MFKEVTINHKIIISLINNEQLRDINRQILRLDDDANVQICLQVFIKYDND